MNYQSITDHSNLVKRSLMYYKYDNYSDVFNVFNYHFVSRNRYTDTYKFTNLLLLIFYVYESITEQNLCEKNLSMTLHSATTAVDVLCKIFVIINCDCKRFRDPYFK